MSESPHQFQNATLVADESNVFNNTSFDISNGNNAPTESPSMKTLAIQFMLSVGLQIGVIILFSLLRPKNNVIYARRQKYIDPTRRPPKLAPGIFSWIRPVLFANHDTLALQLGLDATVFLNFIQFCSHIFFVLGVIVSLVLLPINYSTYMQRKRTVLLIETEEQEFNFAQLSLTAATTNKERLWAHAVMCWVVSGVVYYMGYRLFKKIISLRQGLFASPEYSRQVHTRRYRSDRGLHEWLGEYGVWHPNAVAVINRKIGDLPKLVEKHEHALRQLESLLAKHYKNPDKMPQRRPTRYVNGYYGKKVDAIDYYAEQIDTLETEIYATRQKFSKFSPSSVGFVCYPSVSEAHQAMRVLKHKLRSTKQLTKLKKAPQVTLAVPPEDIIWTNVALKLPERTSRQLSGKLVFMGILLFGVFTVSWMATMADIPKIMAAWTFTKNLFNRFNTFFRLLSASISPILMMLFFMALPRLLRILSKYEGINTGGRIRHSVLKKLFTFLFVNQLTVFMTAFIISITIDISNGRWNTLLQSAEFGFKRIVEAMVRTSNIWVTYITVRGIGIAVELLQLFALIRIFSRRRLFHPTPRELQEFTRPPHFPFEVMYGNYVFLMLIGILFSVISPLILAVASLNFFIALMVFRYQFMYVYATKVERDGYLWPTVYNQCMAAILCFQLVMTVVLTINNAPVQACLVIPLPIITIVLWSFGKSHLLPEFKYTRVPTSPVDQPSSRELNATFTHPAFSGPLLRVMVSKSVQEASQRLWRSHEQKDDPYSDKRKLIDNTHATVATVTAATTTSVITMERDDSENSSVGHTSTWSRPTAASTLINMESNVAATATTATNTTTNDSKSLRMRKVSVSSDRETSTLSELPLQRNIHSQGCWTQDWDVVSEVYIDLCTGVATATSSTSNSNNSISSDEWRHTRQQSTFTVNTITTQPPIELEPMSPHSSSNNHNHSH
ncbi:hypothetical protein BDF22DRAFT_693473 [Syncephalis plumigaleata]|nr:hypothetical protein BDF22DRAFT_693473 [Syncephalis plumigaleata]